MSIELQMPHAWVPEQMEPGTLFLLEQGGEEDANPFRAVLACPACGTLGLITEAQYCGRTPMICGAQHCSAEYKLINDHIHFRRSQ